MERKTFYIAEYAATVELAVYADAGVQEMHAVLHVAPQKDPFDAQLSRLNAAYSQLLSSYPSLTCVFKRYFLSDATNQKPYIPAEGSCAVSYIQQPPLDGSKVAVWCYLVSGVKVIAQKHEAVFTHNGYTHQFLANLYSPSGDSFRQTHQILEETVQKLADKGMSLNGNCLRTWFFLRDVDTQYAGMVKARRELFTQHGLTDETHYIASTGIGGNPAHPSALVQMDAYSVNGLGARQFHHLYAPTHLNPTYEYGVTFERATLAEYGDRSHIFISGTASIDNKGNVLHVGDVVKQCQRMLENVEMLLKEGNATYEDVAQIIVYLRDGADYTVIRDMFSERFPDYPVVITLAPVCRPTWLIEMECIAITRKGNPAYPAF